MRVARSPHATEAAACCCCCACPPALIPCTQYCCKRATPSARAAALRYCAVSGTLYFLHARSTESTCDGGGGVLLLLRLPACANSMYTVLLQAGNTERSGGGVALLRC